MERWRVERIPDGRKIEEEGEEGEGKELNMREKQRNRRRRRGPHVNDSDERTLI